MNDKSPARVERFNPSEIPALLSASRYGGSLRPHMKVMLFMWSQGYSTTEIATHLHTAMGVSTGYLFSSDVSSLRSLVSYALARSEMPPTSRTVIKEYHGLLPEDVRKEQDIWDRCSTALRMKDVGFTHKEIGRRLGDISPARAQQLVAKATKRRRAKQLSPIERYLTNADARPDNLENCGKMGQRIIAALAARTPGRDWLFV